MMNDIPGLGIKIRGAYHSTKNFEIFETGTNGTEISWEKFQKIRKLLNFQKANHSTDDSGDEMERKFPGKIFRKFQIFCSALASSFGLGRDHSELDISLKDDGDAHSIKEIL